MAAYGAAAKSVSQTITFTRSYVMANIFFAPTEYDKLKGFFDDVSNRDRAQAVLHVSAPTQGQ